MSWAKLSTTHPRILATSMLTALAVSVSACGNGSEPTSEADESPSASATPSTPSPTAQKTSPSATATSPPASPTEPATTVETDDAPSAAPVQPPSPGSGPEDMLLRAAEVPGLNPQHGWKPIATENSERRRPVWVCQVTDFSSIGATDVWVRRFVGQPGGGGSAKARSAVITFADTQSAERAYAVLRAWHDRCEEQLSQNHRRVRVEGTATAVEVDPGDAEWRLAVYGPAKGDRNASYFDATGYVREGKRISLVTMVSVGQDYNYPAGEEPIVGAVSNSAIKLLG